MNSKSAVKKCTLVLGGAASGKSLFAEQLVKNTGKNRIYIATSQIFDDEMRQKVEDHKKQRGDGWKTIEEPFDMAKALADATPQDVVLIDCATLWLTNHLLAEHDLGVEQEAFLSAIALCPSDVVIVSNETGLGIVPDNALARRFRNAQGRLNQAIARTADTVVFVAAGLPMVLKGELPR